MNLGEFHTEVGAALARGASLEARIPGFVRRSVQWLEQNYSFKYMEKLAKVTVDANADFPRLITLPARIKNVEFFRRLGSSGDAQLYSYLTQVDPQDVAEVETKAPETYWLVGNDSLVLNSTPAEDFTAEVYYVGFTPWPTAADAEPWLVVNAEQTLLDLTMLNIGVDQRDDAMQQRYGAAFKRSLDVLMTSDAAARQGNRSERMFYGG